MSTPAGFAYDLYHANFDLFSRMNVLFQESGRRWLESAVQPFGLPAAIGRDEPDRQAQGLDEGQALVRNAMQAQTALVAASLEAWLAWERDAIDAFRRMDGAPFTDLMADFAQRCGSHADAPAATVH